MKFICALLKDTDPLATLNSTRFRKIGYDLLLTLLRRWLAMHHFETHPPSRPGNRSLRRLNSSRSTGARASSSRLFMGLPDRSPISDFFHGTIYMTLGCSRSPVTVAVPNSSRSAAAAFCPARPRRARGRGCGAPAERAESAGAPQRGAGCCRRLRGAAAGGHRRAARRPRSARSMLTHCVTAPPAAGAGAGCCAADVARRA